VYDENTTYKIDMLDGSGISLPYTTNSFGISTKKNGEKFFYTLINPPYITMSALGNSKKVKLIVVFVK
jgi:hypothetical protein